MCESEILAVQLASDELAPAVDVVGGGRDAVFVMMCTASAASPRLDDDGTLSATLIVAAFEFSLDIRLLS